MDILSGIRVLDRGQGMPCALVSKFLAELGASVVRECTPDEDPFRAVYVANRVWRLGVESIQPLGDESGALADFDVLILGGEDLPGITRTGEPEKFASEYPRLVVLDITGYPEWLELDGPAVDILVQAQSGLAYHQLGTEPSLIPFKPTLHASALFGLIGILGALVERARSGGGQVVSTSLYDGALFWYASIWFDIERQGPTTRGIPPGVNPLIFRCVDGQFVHIALFAAGAQNGLARALNLPQAEDGGRMPTGSSDPAKIFGDIPVLQAAISGYTSDDLIKALHAEGVMIEKVMQPGDCWDDPQTIANGIIASSPEGDRFVGCPISVSAFSAHAPSTSMGGEKGPLSGSRVVDVGAAVAGPYGSAVLSDLGADVIKVEPLFGDSTRMAFRSVASTNRGKRNIMLDLKQPKGMEVLKRLLGTADVVTSNFRPGVSARLGIDPKSLNNVFPGLCVVESPGYGLTGPRATDACVDMVVQALCGHEARAGGVGNEPLWNRATAMDYTGGLLCAVASLACLFHRVNEGPAATAVVPLYNAGLFLLSELIRGADGKFDGAPLLNHSRTGVVPAECFYQTSDGWIALSARDKQSVERLENLVGSSTDQDTIARYFSERTAADSLGLLAEAGIDAAKLDDDAEQKVLGCKALVEMGRVLELEYPTVGKVSQLGTGLSLSRTPLRPHGRAAEPGEHTREILESLAYSDQEIADLYSANTVR
jgi:crotonobetainyl-CoA:carnitine CoA-transferase CaiB-like acyl-CoA transferase